MRCYRKSEAGCYLRDEGRDSWECLRERSHQQLCCPRWPPPGGGPRPSRSSPWRRTETRPACTCGLPRTTHSCAGSPPSEWCLGWSKSSRQPGWWRQTWRICRPVSHPCLLWAVRRLACWQTCEELLLSESPHRRPNKMNFIIAEQYSLGVFYLNSKVCSNVEVDDRFLEEFSLGHIKDLKGSVWVSRKFITETYVEEKEAQYSLVS